MDTEHIRSIRYNCLLAQILRRLKRSEYYEIKQEQEERKNENDSMIK